jgi:hypothetical protein
MVVIFSNIFISKSILGFQFWTFINVHFEKPEKSLEKDPLIRVLLSYCSHFIYFDQKKCDDNFLMFCAEKDLATFLLSLYGRK